MSRSLPFILEDRTGHPTSTDFDDMYDRLFYHITRQPEHSTTMIYEMPIRASPHRNRSTRLDRDPIVYLEFLPDESLGNISFMKPPNQAVVQMARWLRKTSLFGSSLSRKFVGSDGREYKWSYRSVAGQEWTCTTPENYIVAHYDLKAPGVPSYNVSGNNLTIYEPFAHISSEILASFIIMRHIAQHRL